MINEKFPYGYDVNAYIDKAFERMKADFPWATREMITNDIYMVRRKSVRYRWTARSLSTGWRVAMNGGLRWRTRWRLLSMCRLPADAAATGFWRPTRFGSTRRGAILPMYRRATARQEARGLSSFLPLISSCRGRSFLTSISSWYLPVLSTWAGMIWKRLRA